MNGDQWRKIRSGIRNGVRYEFFIAACGKVSGIPHEFVLACASGKRLAVEFGSSDSGQVRVLRGGKVDFIIDSGLLLQLSRGHRLPVETL